jgi:hypothetical protein
MSTPIDRVKFYHEVDPKSGTDFYNQIDSEFIIAKQELPIYMSSNPDDRLKNLSNHLQDHENDSLELDQKFKPEDEQKQSAQKGSDLPNRQIIIAHSPGAAVDADLSDRV